MKVYADASGNGTIVVLPTDRNIPPIITSSRPRGSSNITSLEFKGIKIAYEKFGKDIEIINDNISAIEQARKEFPDINVSHVRGSYNLADFLTNKHVKRDLIPYYIPVIIDGNETFITAYKLKRKEFWNRKQKGIEKERRGQRVETTVS